MQNKKSLFFAIVFLWLGILACSNPQPLVKENSKTSVSTTPKREVVAPEGYLNKNGVLITDEENFEMANKIEREKKRRKLSDLEAGKAAIKMWDDFLEKKRKH